MSVVQTNVTGCDFIDLEFFTKGSNQAHLTASDKLLLDNKEYILGVSELVVPATSLPIFHPQTAQLLFQIRERTVGNTLVQTLAVGNIIHPNLLGVLRVNPDRKFYNVTEFISDIANWASTYTHLQDAQGVQNGPGANTDHRYLYMNVNAGGRLVINASSEFLNHFVIEVSDFATKLFGLEPYVHEGLLGATRDAVTGIINYELFSNLGFMVAGNHVDSFNFVGNVSVFAHCDNRIFATVETHLDVPSGMQVVESVEQRDNSIGRYFLPNRVNVKLNSQTGFLTSDTVFSSDSRLGMIALKRRDSPIQKWVELKSSYERFLFRFQLYITYRKWNDNRFVLDRVTMPFLADDYWSLVVSFISKV